MLGGIGPGDEVILPSYTFVYTANAFALRGARPVFVDIRPDTLNLDETLIERAITPRTKAVVPVHYAGVGCEMGAILEIARRHRLIVVEDAAQGLGASYGGRALGTLGDLGCWSFHETKNFISGEGGALVVQDEALAERAEILREKGTDRAKFFRGQVDKYTWVDLGSSYAPSELVAAFLYAQLERSSEIMARRLRICDRYRAGLGELEQWGRLRLPVVPAGCQPNGHMFYLLLADEAERDGLIAHLAAAGINAVFHYVPLHDSPMGHSYGYARGDLPVTEALSRRLLRLPCYLELSDSQQDTVVRAVRSFWG
jgi:dTDP-4-amino-4,6-dideoxygalactose transaminase